MNDWCQMSRTAFICLSLLTSIAQAEDTSINEQLSLADHATDKTKTIVTESGKCRGRMGL